jgi:uncharacterized membrane protein
MGTNRIEAFSDAVMAVIITIMVLELKPPDGLTLADWEPVLPEFLLYLLSFIVVAILWFNHHNLLHLARQADPFLLWTNNALLFWMSMIPFVATYLGRHYDAPLAVAAYGLVMSLTSAAFLSMQAAVSRQLPDTAARAAFRRVFWKSGSSCALYALSIGLAFVSVHIALVIFVVFPVIYFFPERAVVAQLQQP